MPCFRAKQTVGAPLDFVAAIETAVILQPMKIVTHDRGVICPAFRRRRHIVVPVKKANPLAGFVDSRHADQFRTETRHNDAKAVLFVSKNIQMPTVTVFFCVRKLHELLAAVHRNRLLGAVHRTAFLCVTAWGGSRRLRSIASTYENFAHVMGTSRALVWP